MTPKPRPNRALPWRRRAGRRRGPGGIDVKLKLSASTFVAGLTLAAAFVATPAAAQPFGPGGGSPPYEVLAPAEIIASVRSAGFGPVSRPALRGPVYVVFAVDRYFMDVRLTVDARSGRVLTATRLAGMLHGGPGYDGYEVLPGGSPQLGYLPPYEPSRGLRPPADIPRAAAAPPPRTPLPRGRPDEVRAAKEADSQRRAEPQAAAPPVVVPPPAPATPAQPPAAAAPQQPAMVPVAPLE
jgi:hypothetical protein